MVQDSEYCPDLSRNAEVITRLERMRHRLERKLAKCGRELLAYTLIPAISKGAEARLATLARRFQELEQIACVLNVHRARWAG